MIVKTTQKDSERREDSVLARIGQSSSEGEEDNDEGGKKGGRGGGRSRSRFTENILVLSQFSGK